MDEALAVRVDQPRALAAQRLRQQESRRASSTQRRRVKLDELEVGHARAGLERHGDAVAGRDGGFVVSRKTCPAPPVASSVARRSTSSSRPSPTDERRAATHRRRRITSDIASASSMTRDARGAPRRCCHSTRPISRPVASRACSTRRTLCAASRPSAGAPSASRSKRAPQSISSRRSADRRSTSTWTASGHTEAVAGGDRVRDVQLGRIVGADRCGDAALGVAGIALARIGLGEDDDVAGFRQRERGAQPGDAAADDQEVAAHVHGLLSYQPAQARDSALRRAACITDQAA